MSALLGTLSVNSLSGSNGGLRELTFVVGRSADVVGDDYRKR